ncbi:MAG: nucleotidyltransferase domain-containing protein [Azonexus sp.]|nr:nucleotidyltransferase domain-containing protein [Azonexus sp.]
MRISEDAARRAISLISAQFGDGAKIWLFGSRVDDQKRGGDVDIFVETESADALRKVKCKSDLTDLFDLKVDLIVGTGDKPIHRIAKSTGVRLR